MCEPGAESSTALLSGLCLQWLQVQAITWGSLSLSHFLLQAPATYFCSTLQTKAMALGCLGLRWQQTNGISEVCLQWGCHVPHSGFAAAPPDQPAGSWNPSWRRELEQTGGVCSGIRESQFRQKSPPPLHLSPLGWVLSACKSLLSGLCPLPSISSSL